jgi:hypothetical protein
MMDDRTTDADRTDRAGARNRLRGLRLGMGSGGNLAAIGEAVLGERPQFGWTEGACQRLRDTLVRLLSSDTDDATGVAHVGTAYVQVVPRIDWAQLATEFEAFAELVRELQEEQDE